ncbi:heme peroxidase [Umbelopsis sp. PMI_123]|nr:heme peroxidase [Umbelopsis sp. PMI_123]
MVDILNNILYGATGVAHWWTLPLIAALIHLSLQRERLLSKHLFDSYADSDAKPPKAGPCGEAERRARTLNGMCNNLEQPSMGMVGYRFSRNVAPEWVEDPSRLLEPNPREVASKLMARDVFKPAETLNLMATAWIHFQVHDWMSHKRGVGAGDYIHIPLPEDDPWRPDHTEMTIPRSVNDSQRGDNPERHVSFANEQTHWWDLSQIYGTNTQDSERIRSFVDGKLKLDENGLLYTDKDGMEITGMKQNWWLGLSMLHNLFSKEHNSICDFLKEYHPDMDDQELYDKARLINSAVNAKIHTVEWTPAILADEAGYIALQSNWFGLENVFPDQKFMIEILRTTGILSHPSTYGIVGNPAVFYGVPYSLTEEFTAVYRFHPFLPDNLTVVDTATGDAADGDVYRLIDVTFRRGTAIMHKYNFKDILATFGTKYMGALVLNNFPKDLLDFTLPYDHPPTRIDLATVDIVRDRERGVPRINNLRRGVGLPAFKNWEDLNPDPQVIAKLKSVYKSIEDVDCLVGMAAEMPRPPGWAFGDTTFTVFVAMASRRLMTDRFLTDDFTAEYYSQEGIDWVRNATFKDVLLRHAPELKDLLDTVSNPFAPWTFK